MKKQQQLLSIASKPFQLLRPCPSVKARRQPSRIQYDDDDNGGLLGSIGSIDCHDQTNSRSSSSNELQLVVHKSKRRRSRRKSHKPDYFHLTMDTSNTTTGGGAKPDTNTSIVLYQEKKSRCHPNQTDSILALFCKHENDVDTNNISTTKIIKKRNRDDCNYNENNNKTTKSGNDDNSKPINMKKRKIGEKRKSIPKPAASISIPSPSTVATVSSKSTSKSKSNTAPITQAAMTKPIIQSKSSLVTRRSRYDPPNINMSNSNNNNGSSSNNNSNIIMERQSNIEIATVSTSSGSLPSLTLSPTDVMNQNNDSSSSSTSSSAIPINTDTDSFSKKDKRKEVYIEFPLFDADHHNYLEQHDEEVAVGLDDISIGDSDEDSDSDSDDDDNDKDGSNKDTEESNDINSSPNVTTLSSLQQINNPKTKPPRRRKKTISQIRKTVGKRFTLSLVKPVNRKGKTKKSIVKRSQVTKHQKKSQQLFLIREDKNGSIQPISTCTTTTAVKQRNHFIGVKPTDLTIPMNTESRASLSQKLNPNFVAFAANRPKNILEGRTLYASPRPTTTSRALVVHQNATTSNLSSSRTVLPLDRRIVTPNGNSVMKKPTGHSHNIISPVNNNAGHHRIDSDRKSTMTLHSFTLDYINNKIKSLQQIQSNLQRNHRKYRFNKHDLDQLCDSDLSREIMHHYSKRNNDTTTKSHPRLHHSNQLTVFKCSKGPREFIPNTRGNNVVRKTTSARKCIDFNQEATTKENGITESKFMTESYFASPSLSKKNAGNDKQAFMDSDSEEEFESKIQNMRQISSLKNMNQPAIVTPPKMTKETKMPTLSPYGNTWLEFQLDATSSSSDDEDKSVGDIGTKNNRTSSIKKNKVRRKIRLLESEDSDSDFDNDESDNDIEDENERVEKSLVNSTSRKRGLEDLQVDSLQFLGVQ